MVGSGNNNVLGVRESRVAATVTDRETVCRQISIANAMLMSHT